MFLNIILENKTKKVFVLLTSVILIATVWHMERIRRISQYGIVFHGMGLQCDDECGQNKQIQYFQKAIHYDPNLSAAHYRLACIYEKMGDDNNAFKSFLRVTELDSWNVLAFYNVGRYYFEEHHYENARRYFLHAYSKKTGCPEDINYYLAKIYDQWQEYILALRFYNGIASLNSEYAIEVYPRVVELYHLINKASSIEGKIRELRIVNKNELAADELERSFKVFQASEASGKKYK